MIILLSGVEGAGKGQVVNRLNQWLDSRGIETNAFWDETDASENDSDHFPFDKVVVRISYQSNLTLVAW